MSSRRARGIRPTAFAWALLAGGVISAAVTPLARADPAAAFRGRHGSEWTVQLDAVTSRPRRVIGGAVPLVPRFDQAVPAPGAFEAIALGELRRFLRVNADVLQVDPDALRPLGEGIAVSAGGRFAVANFEIVHAEVPIAGARVQAVVSHGHLTYLHLVGTEPVNADATPLVTSRQALVTALARASLSDHELLESPVPRLVFLRAAGGHRLAWQVELIELEQPRRRVAVIDAKTGAVVSLTDETVSACDPPPAGESTRRVLGGVRIERADEPERVELLPGATVGPVVSDDRGVFPSTPPPYSSVLAGTHAIIECQGCTNPVSPLAPAGLDGDVDFGSGGVDEVGNGTSTPADRAVFFHLEGVRRQASRWLSLSYLVDPMPGRTNLDSDCNAYYDGRRVNFFRSSATCRNTGEIRDVIAHEWGHGLDHNDGIRLTPLAIDGATGEAVADIVAILRSRDPCIGESFRDTSRPSTDCTGVRNADEKATGHRLGTLTLSNVVSKCPPSGFYRGPLGRQGHCEGVIFGETFWHLVQNFLTGVSYTDGTPLGSDPLSEEQAWQLAERLFFLSRALLVSYAPTDYQSLGTSAYDAFFLVDDEGDGVANGTPHAAALQDAFDHHGMSEVGPPPPDTADCVPPPEPTVAVVSTGDPGTGLPALEVSWNDVGAASHVVLRADAADDAYLPIAVGLGPGAGTHRDVGVLPGRAYWYRVLAEDATGCLSASPGAITATPGALLRIARLVIDDPLPGGNGDGQLEDGETVSLSVDLHNAGTGPLTNAQVSLEFSHPSLSVTGPAVMAYGTIPQGMTVTAPAAFQVQVGPGAVSQVVLRVNAETDQGCLRDEQYLDVIARDLQLEAHVVDDPAGDGDGSWEPGEQVDLLVLLSNVGLLDAALVNGVIAFDGPPSPGVTIVDDRADWGAIAAGGAPVTTTPPHFQLMADVTVAPRTPVPLTLDVFIGADLHRSFDLELTVGAFPPPAQEWALTMETWGTPVVLPLEDTDGDGVITGCDESAIICGGENSNGEVGVFAFRGTDGSLLWSAVSSDGCVNDRVYCTVSQGALAGGDVNNDGLNEILVPSGGFLTALSSTGAHLWTTPDRVSATGAHAPQVWDLDADGFPEVIVGASVVSGMDGSLLWEATNTTSPRFLIADLDLDGLQEAIMGPDPGHVRRADGSVYPVSFPDFVQFGGVVNLDTDPHPEIVYFHDTTITGRNHDGSLVFQVNNLTNSPAPPTACFGDLDGDGLAESVFSVVGEMWAMRPDGTMLWRTPVDEGVGLYSSCAVFDFDGDGQLEVVHRDRRDLSILDGRTGDRLWTVVGDSPTLYEGPVVADVDADGSAEIVTNKTRVGGIGAPHTLVVFGNAAWPPARAVWNQEAYSVTHVADDGEVVRFPVRRWLEGNDFKGQTGPCACVPPQPDFTVRLPDCSQATACFEPELGGAVVTGDLTWDFGDGSLPVTGAAPCHSFPGPGDYVVKLTVGDEFGCLHQDGRLVTIAPNLSVDFRGTPECDGRQSCFMAAASGGTPPYEFAWDFGDGTQATGPDACHVFPRTLGIVTVFVRDAVGCLAEMSRDLRTLRPPVADVGPFLFAVDHGSPFAPDITATFDWSGEPAAPRPPGHHYHLVRNSRPDWLIPLTALEPHFATTYLDSTPSSGFPPLGFVHYYKVFAADECEVQSGN